MLSPANNFMINISIRRFILEKDNEELMFRSVSWEHYFENVPGKENKILVLTVLHLFCCLLKLMFCYAFREHYFEDEHGKENDFLVLTVLHLFIIFFQNVSCYSLLHCVKSLRIRSYSGLRFPTFWLNTKRYRVSLRIQSECRKMWEKCRLE